MTFATLAEAHMVGLDIEWRLPDELCEAIVSSTMLWMFDRTKAGASSNPWTMLLLGSGRAVPP